MVKMQFGLPEINSIYAYIKNEIYFIACYYLQKTSLIPFNVFNKEQTSATFVCISYLIFVRNLCTEIK